MYKPWGTNRPANFMTSSLKDHIIFQILFVAPFGGRIKLISIFIPQNLVLKLLV